MLHNRISMLRLLPFLLFLSLHAETRTLTLAEVLEAVQKQSPDLILARLDERKAAEAARAARDPFLPKLFAGSGLAYSSGFPLSIEGSAPSIVESRAIASIFNRPQRLLLDKARQDVETAKLSSEAKRDEAAYRAAALYLEAARHASALRSVGQQLSNLTAVQASTQARVEGGRELPIESRRAALRLAQTRQRRAALEQARADAESQLALVAAVPGVTRIQPNDAPQSIAAATESEQQAIATALENSKEIRRLESVLIAKGLEAKSHAAARLPRVDLVAQYGLFARFNNYDKFFNRFQRHNGQLGVSFQVPILPSLAARSQQSAAEAESAALRSQLNAERARVAARARGAYLDIATCESGVEVAKFDLDIAREQTTLLLAQFDEGRASQKQIEESRYLENEKWMALFDARYTLDRAKLDFLRDTGTLLGALRN